MSALRQDVHSPNNVVMENYDYVGSYDSDPMAYLSISIGYMGQKIVEELPGAARARQLQKMIADSTESRHDGRCDHCGAGIRYRAVLRHRPTGQAIQVGETCLENRFALATADFKAMKKAAEEARAGQRIRKAIDAFVEANPDLAWMASEEASRDKAGYGVRDRPNFFIFDVSRKLRSYGELSDRQAAAVRTSVIKDAEFDAKRAAQKAAWAAQDAARPHADAPRGRVTITGEVVTVRQPDDQAMYPSYKWLVRDDRGFKVWGSIPSGVTRVGNHYVSYEAMKGARVTFSAEVTPKDGEPEFAFYSRPTKASMVAPAPVEGSGK